MDDRRSSMKERGYDKLFSDITIEELSHKIVRLAKQRDAWQEKAMNMIEKSTHKELEMENQRLVQRKANDIVSKEAYQVMWDNCEKLKKDLKKTDDIVENNDKIYKKNLQEQEDKVLALSSKICNLLSIIEEKDELLDKQTAHTEYWRDAYYKSSTVKGEVKMFSEIPNDASGKAFVAQLKEYLNTDSYSVRVRGQYLNDETKQAEGWRPYSYGQPISKSKCLRIYVNPK